MLTEVFPIENLGKKELKLVRQAIRARKRAYAPYSKYYVGCALSDNKGKLHTGCNVENASYSAAICAERTAIVKMVSRGGKKIYRIVVAASSEEPVFPCGVCLQVMAEFGMKADVIAVNKRGTLFRRAQTETLFPFAFDPDKLGG